MSTPSPSPIFLLHPCKEGSPWGWVGQFEGGGRDVSSGTITPGVANLQQRFLPRPFLLIAVRKTLHNAKKASSKVEAS
jgi:hypothetical protein